MCFFPNLKPVLCSMSDSNCCFLACKQVSQEASKMIWYPHLFKNFPQFVVIHIVNGFSMVSEAEVNVFLKFPCFFCDSADVGYFTFLHFFLFGIVLVTASCTVLQTSVHSSSGTLFTGSNHLSLFVTSPDVHREFDLSLT